MPGIFLEPDDLCVYVTEACNSNCVMCPMSLASRRRGLTMAPEQWSALKEIDPQAVFHHVYPVEDHAVHSPFSTRGTPWRPSRSSGSAFRRRRC